jgi:nucleoside-triphosphatase THEP1
VSAAAQGDVAAGRVAGRPATGAKPGPALTPERAQDAAPADRPRARLFVITGERGAGKSVACARLAGLLRERGVDVGGVITERSEAGSDREAVDVATGARRPFGRQGQAGEAPSAAPAQGVEDPLTPSWRYDDDVFRWGNEVFARDGDREVLLVDELGPVELLGGRGWTRPLERLAAGDFQTAVVVCRPGLLDRLSTLVGRPPDSLFVVTVENRDGLPGAVAEAVLTTKRRPSAAC